MVDWLAGNRVRGTSTERTTSTGFNDTTTVSGGWKELGRTTLGSSSADYGVTGLDNKRYLMVLVNNINAGQVEGDSLRFNNDTTANQHAGRYSNDGGTDGTITNTTKTGFFGFHPHTQPSFAVMNVANLSTEEKLGIIHSVGHSSNVSGAGNAPNRAEVVAKYINTSNPVSSIQQVTSWSTYSSGSEMVVLGWDEDDTHTTNFWEELASVSGDGSSTTLSTGTVIDKKYIWIQAYLETTGQMKGDFRVGNGSVDGAGTYSFRISNNGGSDAAHDVKGSLTEDMPNALHHFVNIFAINNASNEGLFIGNDVGVVTTGAGTEPIRQEFVAKWANTSNQFNILDVVSGAGDGNWSSKSILKVWGSD